MSTRQLVRNFFGLYLAFPVILLFYIAYKIVYRTPFIRSHNMDLNTGIR